ncbi:hypothetical protein [Paraburkholderia domus]|uniref:hypothetical protein n=1 Tax=Paraburkholderia domus TaxID=2793075 RepID=UPI0019134AFC|nr:hypothetical protein [Paraburkholderia domus]MBK5061733.1 hypothetical protein [Burkholderia sp. R-70199]CAE6899461.1 hypothetical protein R70199_03606 [Paraburkholderia domus]
MSDTENMAVVDTVSFDERLHGIVGQIVDECEREGATDLIARVNAAVKAEYAALEADGKCQLAFPGCRIVGGIGIVHAGLQQLRLIPATAFHPQARHLHDDRDALALGFFNEFDLHLQSHAGLPPTVLARYGDHPHQCSSFNPTFTKFPDILPERRPVFTEAIARARALSFMC